MALQEVVVGDGNEDEADAVTYPEDQRVSSVLLFTLITDTCNNI